jgi:hypothetical protein
MTTQTSIKGLTILTIVLLSLSLPRPGFGQKTQQERMDSIYRQKEANLPAWTFNINLLDAALYGPIIQMEFKISNRGYIVPWLRYNYAGVVSNYNWTNFEDDSKYDPSSVALAVGYKKFIPGDDSRQLIYWGFFGEFIHETGMQNTGSDYEYEQTRLAGAVYLNVGYRWKSRRNFYLSLGVLPGYYYDFQNEGTFTNSGGPYPEDFKKHNLTGMIDFSFGWNFER